jgi:hypothetical protein
MVARLGAGVAAAVVVGTGLGAVARLLMALVALSADGSSTFSWSGTTFILLIFVLAMVPGAAVAALTRHRLRWLLPGAGALFLCVPAIGVAGAEVGATAGFDAGQWSGVAIAGLGVFATIALLPVLTVRLTDRRTRRQPPSGDRTSPSGVSASRGR